MAINVTFPGGCLAARRLLASAGVCLFGMIANASAQPSGDVEAGHELARQ